VDLVCDLDVLVVGDANPDLVLRGDVVPRFGQAEQLLDGADLVLAGSAGIVAAGTARLGLRTALVAHVGRDLFGQLVVSALDERGVDVSSVHVEGDVPTGLSVILSAPGDRAILTRLGALARLDPDAVGDGLLARARHVHVASWFLLPGLVERGARLLARARAAGCTTSLDTNWDPAQRWAGVRDALPVTDVLLPNEVELVALAAALGPSDPSTSRTSSGPTGPTGPSEYARRAPADLDEVAGRLRAAGPDVAAKAGAAGALGWDADGRHRAAGVRVEVVDTTGAGDSFDAGFLAARLDGRPFAECLRWAAVCGSLSTRAAGGTQAQATRTEVEGLV
jgi:sugar/nucleoside kinase (ribokinase family)